MVRHVTEPKWWLVWVVDLVGFGLGWSHALFVPQFPQVMVWIRGVGLLTGMASVYKRLSGSL